MQMIQYIAMNGALIPKEDAAISPDDRGFRLGDGAFETLRIAQNVPYQWDFHMHRLKSALDILRIDFDVRRLKPLVKALIHKNQSSNGFLRIQITRGEGSTGYRPASNAPSYFIETSEPLPLDESICQLWISSYRRPATNHLPANGKFTHGIANTLALLEASDNACEDAIMLSADGYISETASANIFWLKDDVLFTPDSKATACLEGSIRHAVLELSPYPVKKAKAQLKSLKSADAIFTTNVRSVLRACNIKAQPITYEAYGEQVIELLRQTLLDKIITHSLTHKDSWL